MGDECTCRNCQAGSVGDTAASVWPVVRTEAQAENRERSSRELALVVTDGGISLRQQSYEM